MTTAEDFESPTEERKPGKHEFHVRRQHCLKSRTFSVSGFFSLLYLACRAARPFLLTCAIFLLAVGCGGGTEDGEYLPLPPSDPAPPTRPNPVELEFRPTDIEPPSMSDGKDYKDDEFMAHYGLGNISADKAYNRGYFGQGAIIAVADDGMDPTHPDLAVSGKIRNPWHVRNQNAVVREPNVREPGHGTYVALIAAGAMGNTDGSFEITVDGGPPVPTRNIHGVAPQASVMPIAMEGGGQPVEAIRYAAENGAHVLNLSIGISTFYNGKYTGRDGVWLAGPLPYFRPLLNLDLGDQHTISLRQEFAEVAGILEDQDIVLVWAAGNEGWNSGNERAVVWMCGKNFIDEEGCLLGNITVSPQEFMENFVWIYDKDNPDRTVSFEDMWGNDCGEKNCVEYNSSGEWREAPLFESRLLGKWIVTAASNENGEISSFSNGCGAARNWCLVAPGEDLTIRPGDPISGTSFAAPMVSGALAALRSRFPDMTMEIIQAILLISADPVGIRKENPEEPDPVYGWGLLNLGNAVILQDMVSLPYSVHTTTGTTRAISPGYYRPSLLPASVQTHAGSRYHGLRQEQCVSPYEILRRYQNLN